MNSNQSSKVTPKVTNTELSMDNLKSAVETWLRSVGKIKDSDDVYLTFGTVSNALTVTEWEKRNTVPLQIHAREGVQVFKFG